MLLLVLINTISIVCASELSYDRENRIKFGHVLYIQEAVAEPSIISPGQQAVLKLTVENIAQDSLRDVRIKVSLPAYFAPFNDMTQQKIEELKSGEIKEVNFNIIALPNAVEGVYNTTITATYVNIVGDELVDTSLISLVVSGTPKVFAEIQESELYKEKSIGTVTLKFVNNDIANIKFLTVNLEKSQDYEILSSDKEYIGDLDSDDSETVDFKLKVNTNKNSVDLPVLITYKDSLNRDYSEKIVLTMPIRSAAELGIRQDNILLISIGIAILIIVGFIIYKRWRRKNAKRLH